LSSVAYTMPTACSIAIIAIPREMPAKIAQTTTTKMAIVCACLFIQSFIHL
jgi:hypothetical protein